jgi:uncharacterized membrane protein SpoIIM required for sporulation
MVDIDRFIARNQPSWERLEALAGRRTRTLTTAELDELIGLYQRASGHLAYARTHFREPGLLARLTMLVAGAHGAIYGRRSAATGTLRRFLLTSYPAAVWHCRRAVLASAAFLLVPAVAVGIWLGVSDAALDAAMPEELQEALLASEFEDYYSSAPAQDFTSLVTINNIQVSVVAFALGALLVPGALILVYNGVNVGVAAGLFASAGRLPEFFGLILPHGLLELTAVVIAGGAGLQMGWALVVPGDRTRSAALAEEGRRSVVLVLGTIGAFVVAGVIEGFVTPAPIPTVLRVAVGVLVWVSFLAWVIGRGRVAAAAGFTGHPDDDLPAWDRWRGIATTPAALAPAPPALAGALRRAGDGSGSAAAGASASPPGRLTG